MTEPDLPSVRARRDVAVAGHQGNESLVREALTHPNAGVRATALGALARVEKITNADIETALKDESPAVRQRACAVATGYPKIDLLPLLIDDDASVVETAAWALGEQGVADNVRIDALAAIVQDHEDALCREAAVASLGSLGSERCLPAILAATNDKATVRRRAVIALAPFSGPEVTAALEKALVDRDWQVRQAAEDLLRN